MQRRFIVCIDGSNKEQQDKITIFLKNEKPIGYWHWFSDMWLVVDPSKKWTASELHMQLNNLMPGLHKIVFQIDGENTWTGFGPTEMFTWLKDTWSKD